MDREKARQIKLFITDVDGVLTEGQLILGTQHQEWKSFNAQDGLGIALAKQAGLMVAIVTGRYSEAVERRAQELDLKLVYQKIKDKRKILLELLAELDLKEEETAYIGDDLNDLPILEVVGLKIAVANAAPEVKARVDYVTEKEGGRGAVREALALILQAQGKWDQIVESYLKKPEEGGAQ